jgi:hypothetical protein
MPDAVMDKRREQERLAQWKLDLMKELAEVKTRAADLEKKLELYRGYARELEATVVRLKGMERNRP